MSRVSSLIRRAADGVRPRPKSKAPAPPGQRTSSPVGRGPAFLYTPPKSGLRRLLLVVLYILEVGVDHVVAAAALLAAALARTGLGAVDRLAELEGRLRERAGFGLDVVHVVALRGRLETGDRALDGALV